MRGSASSLAKLEDMKEAIGQTQFEHYMKMHMPLSEYYDKMVSIGDLYTKDFGEWNKKEIESLKKEGGKERLIKLLTKEDQLQRNTVNVANIDTHQVSTHKTADESHVRIFKRMLEARKDLGVEANFESDRSVKITKAGELEKFVQEKNKALQTKVNTSVKMTDEELYNAYVRHHDIEKFKTVEFKDLSESDKESFQPKIEGFRFRLEAAKRFMDDMLEHHNSGNGTYSYATNSKAACGLTMEQMVATAYWAGKDKNQYRESVGEINSFIGIVESLYDMRRGYDIDRGTDKPEENIYPKLSQGDRDNNSCHGGSVNSLASGMANIHESYEVKVVLRSDIEREIQNIYKKIVKENISLFEGQEQTLKIWTATGKITGDVRQKLQDVFDVSYKQEFEGTYKGYINDNEFQNIILQGLDNVPIPDDLRRESKLEGIRAEELYQAIKNEMIPLLHYSKKRGFESTLNYLASLDGHEDIYEELVALAISENPKEPGVQNGMSFLSRSRLPQELQETKVYELKGSSIPLSAIAELNERELRDLFSINHSQFLEEAVRMNLYGLIRLAVKNVGLSKDELNGRYGSNRLTLLHVACNWGNLVTARFLLEKGADVNAKDKIRGNTPLHLALQNRQFELANFLIEKGASVSLGAVLNCSDLRSMSVLKSGYINQCKTALSNMAHNAYEVFKGAAKIQSGDFEGIYEKLEERQNKNTFAEKEIANQVGTEGKKER